jgi:orotate phosphoribosyltransferase
MGGVIIGHEMGRALGVEAIFLERPEGTFELRRGFELQPGQRVLMVEDVVTTGLSSRQAMDAVRAAGAIVVAEAALVDRWARRNWACPSSRWCLSTSRSTIPKTFPPSLPPSRR